jgi:hypothetical protein
MRAIDRCILFGSLLAATLAAGAQDRKPGLYDVTLTTTTVSPSSSVYPPRTSQACLTQEMIDKYGAIVPQNLSRLCQLTNVVKKAGGMSADIACSGALIGKGTMEVNWTDGEHSKGNIHFSGTMHPGEKEIKIEWNAATASVYKGPDCSTLKPATP